MFVGQKKFTHCCFKRHTPLLTFIQWLNRLTTAKNFLIIKICGTLIDFDFSFITAIIWLFSLFSNKIIKQGNQMIFKFKIM